MREGRAASHQRALHPGCYGCGKPARERRGWYVGQEQQYSNKLVMIFNFSISPLLTPTPPEMTTAHFTVISYTLSPQQCSCTVLTTIAIIFQMSSWRCCCRLLIVCAARAMSLSSSSSGTDRDDTSDRQLDCFLSRECQCYMNHRLAGAAHKQGSRYVLQSVTMISL